MFHRLKESTIYVFGATATFFRYFWFGLVALSDWLRGFALADRWLYAFLLPKILIIVMGLFSTNIPLWILVPISFLPFQIVGPLLFIAFIVALAR